jgi:hypothetical protein
MRRLTRSRSSGGNAIAIFWRKPFWLESSNGEVSAEAIAKFGRVD